MKKILIIANIGGFLQKFEMSNVSLLQQIGYEVHYAANENGKTYPFDKLYLEKRNIKFHHIDISRSPFNIKENIIAYFQIKKILENEKIGIIHCHTPVGGLLGRLSAVFKDRKVIYTAHGLHFYKGGPLINNTIFKITEKILAHFTNSIVLINHEDYEYANTFHLRRNGKRYLIPGVGIDLNYFKPVDKEEKIRIRKELGIDENCFFVLSIGELNVNKNISIVIDAIQRLHNEKLIENIQYGICGEGDNEKSLKQKVSSLNAESYIHFFGFVTNAKDYYSAADVTVFPSIREGLGMVGLESLAMGIPVIASNNRGTREYIYHGKNGYMNDYDDLNGFTNNLLKLYKLPFEKYDEMSKNCLKIVESFSVEKTQEIMKDVYMEI